MGEATSGLRVIPNLDVIRPADPEEVAGAFMASVDRKNGPTAVVLSRQNVRTLSEIPVARRREGTLKGGYVALRETMPLEMIILACGSELQWAMDAAKELGGATRVVSMPSFERFDRQDSAYKAQVLPSGVTKRIAIKQVSLHCGTSTSAWMARSLVSIALASLPLATLLWMHLVSMPNTSSRLLSLCRRS